MTEVKIGMCRIAAPQAIREYARSVIHETEDGVQVRCLSGLDLLESKVKAGRPQDLEDAEFLEKKKQAGLLE
jgi:hypothetical protein